MERLDVLGGDDIDWGDVPGRVSGELHVVIDDGHVAGDGAEVFALVEGDVELEFLADVILLAGIVLRDHVDGALEVRLRVGSARPDDLVVIYMAGHGSPDPNDSRNLYFLTYDTRVDDMGGTAFAMYQLQDVYDRVLKARRVVTFVDSCHSFGVSGEKNLGGPKNNLINQYIQRFASNGERAVLTASDTSELSYEDARWGGGHGVFTYYVLKGMAHDADANHDGTVTVAELSLYLRDKVSGDTEKRQNPQAIIGGVGSIPVSTVASGGVKQGSVAAGTM